MELLYCSGGALAPVGASISSSGMGIGGSYILAKSSKLKDLNVNNSNKDFTFKDLSNAGKMPDRGGLTKAGRALSKHGGRAKSVFNKPKGSPAEINKQGQKMLERILNHPDKTIAYKTNKRYGNFINIKAPGIGGARYNGNGELIGFLET